MKKTGGEIIIDSLINEEIKYVAGIPGHGCLGIFDALRIRVEAGKIEYLQVMQEMDAVFMADGHYRASGKPMAVLTSIGPGSLNTIIGLGTAFVDSIPVLVIVGDTHTHMRGTGVLQEIERKHDTDILSCFRPVTKRCWRVEDIAQLPKIMQRAFNVMLTGRKGPVVISVPMDIQSEAIEFIDHVPATRKAGDIIPGDIKQIRQAVAIMTQAARPLILAGGGVLHSFAYEGLQQLAQSWGAAVVTTMAGKSCFPEDHPLYGWHGGSKGTDVGNHLCRTADVVLALGCRFADETTSSYRKNMTYKFPDARLIQVDIDPGEIGKNYPCDVSIIGDVRAVMTQLEVELHSAKQGFQRQEYHQEIRQFREDWLNSLRQNRKMIQDELTISGFLAEFQKIFPQDGFVVTSSGNTQAQVLQEYCFTVPGTHITTGGFSTMGFALPAAVGVKLAAPGRTVAVLIGDGDFLMCLQTMQVLAQMNLPILVVVLNNQGWMAIRDLQIDVFGEQGAFGNDFKTADGLNYSPDFSRAARAFGLKSYKVEDPGQLPGAMELVKSITEPTVLEIMVSSEYPQSGGRSTGWWDVPVPAYMEQRRKEYLAAKAEETIN